MPTLEILIENKGNPILMQQYELPLKFASVLPERGRQTPIFSTTVSIYTCTDDMQKAIVMDNCEMLVHLMVKKGEEADPSYIAGGCQKKELPLKLVMAASVIPDLYTLYSLFSKAKTTVYKRKRFAEFGAAVDAFPPAIAAVEELHKAAALNLMDAGKPGGAREERIAAVASYRVASLACIEAGRGKVARGVRVHTCTCWAIVLKKMGEFDMERAYRCAMRGEDQVSDVGHVSGGGPTAQWVVA